MLTDRFFREKGKQFGIPMMGFLAEPILPRTLTRLEIRLKRNGPTPFVRINPKDRIDYKRVWSGTQAVIVFGLPYILKIRRPVDMRGRGQFASFCHGRDYHLVMSEKMNTLMFSIEQETNLGLEWRIFVDNGQLVDREAAWQAGLGFFGKNNLLISPEFGSAFTIGQCLINQPIETAPVQPMASRCGDCDLCLKACPYGALESGFSLIPEKCGAYLTQKKNLSKEEASRLTDYLYGCDYCQLVCPWNRGLAQEDDCEDDCRCKYPILSKIEAMDKETYGKVFADSNVKWRGLAVLQRNAKIMMNHEDYEH